MELEQSLKRLALLDKTQEEIEKISKVIIYETIKRSTVKKYILFIIYNIFIYNILFVGCDQIENVIQIINPKHGK